MKAAAAIAGIALAGFTSAEAPGTLPKILGAKGQYAVTGCDDLAKIRFDWTPDSFSVNLPYFYHESKFLGDKAWDHPGNTAVDADDSAYLCPLDLDWKIPAGWRFRITNVTFSGTVSTEGGAYLTDFRTESILYYQRFEAPSYALKYDRTTDMGDVFTNSTSYGKDGDFASSPVKISGETVPDKFWDMPPNGEERPVFDVQWTPCINDKEGVYETVRFQYRASAGLVRTAKLADPSKAKVTVGKPNGQSDVKLTWGIEWEKCDPATFTPATWGRGYTYPEST